MVGFDVRNAKTIQALAHGVESDQEPFSARKRNARERRLGAATTLAWSAKILCSYYLFLKKPIAMNVSIIKHYDCHEIVNRLSTDCHAYPADCHHPVSYTHLTLPTKA